jgi:YggT family protein
VLGNLIIVIGIIIHYAINVMIGIIIIRAILSWVPSTMSSPVARFLVTITEPILAPIRSVLPYMGLDISPMIAILGLYFVDGLLIKSLITIGHRIAMGY